MFDGIDWQAGKDPQTFKTKLGRFYAELEKRLKLTAKAIAEAGVERAKGKAPVDTGALRDSLQSAIEEMQNIVVIKIGTDVDYAIHQEFGTVYHEAQPFLRPTLTELEPIIVDRTAEAYNDALYAVF